MTSFFPVNGDASVTFFKHGRTVIFLFAGSRFNTYWRAEEMFMQKYGYHFLYRENITGTSTILGEYEMKVHEENPNIGIYPVLLNCLQNIDGKIVVSESALNESLCNFIQRFYHTKYEPDPTYTTFQFMMPGEMSDEDIRKVKRAFNAQLSQPEAYYVDSLYMYIFDERALIV